jgi:hypothetical protein
LKLYAQIAAHAIEVGDAYELKAKTLSFEAEKRAVVKTSKGKVEIAGDGGFKVDAKKGERKSSGAVTIKGSKVSLN